MINTPSSDVSTQKPELKDCCNKPEGCGNCMKGGMPLKKEMLSFMTLFLIGVVTVLTVLLVTEKRAKLSDLPAPAGEPAQVSVMKYEMPAVPSVREVIQLPDPKLKGTLSVEAALQARRSRRFFSDEAVTMQELSQILWSAQGMTDEAGHRAAPSARSAYPFSVYVVVRNVADLDAGLYVYNPKDHTLGSLGLANAGEKLIAAGVQDNSQKSPVVLALVAAPAIMQAIAPTNDPMPNINLEAGHIGQNIYLQVEALQMATVVTGGFDKNKVAAALELDPVNQVVSYLVPFGNIGEAPVEVKE
ncbi:SagB/ThcOx family dehydrogenase [Candidatus Woesebacteria bacterium]|nr:SagB/ThcOx family dehydrogenase [Candidatus Woesebacteria bacterium]